MTSGAKVSDNMKDTFQEMKLSRNDGERIRIATFVIDKDKGSIDVETIIREKNLEKDAFLTFKDMLEPTKCRYILYDCKYHTVESVKQELIFAMWCPETGAVKDKMKYASSRDAMKGELNGLKYLLQLNDLADCSTRINFAELLGKQMISLEGEEVKM